MVLTIRARDLMYIAELFTPGSQIEFEGKNKIEISRLLAHMEYVVYDAAISISLFEEALEKSRMPLSKWEKIQDLKASATKEISAESGSLYQKPTDDQKLEIGRRYQTKLTELDMIPVLYERRLPFIHAHSFLYAVDCIGKIIDELASFEDVPENAQAIAEKFDESFPSVRKIRNSALHIEDRLQGYGPLRDKRKGKKMDTGLRLSDLEGNQLCYTIHDGTQERFEISSDTLSKTVEMVNQLLASFAWTGSSRVEPHI